jgi:hypothetical protein
MNYSNKSKSKVKSNEGGREPPLYLLEKGSCINGPKDHFVPLVPNVCSTDFKGLATSFRGICGYIFIMAILKCTF